MADAVDQAAALEQIQRDYALAAAKKSPEQPNEYHGHRYCIDCDIEITTKRLMANPNAVRCVECQTLQEHKNRRFYP